MALGPSRSGTAAYPRTLPRKKVLKKVRKDKNISRKDAKLAKKGYVIWFQDQV